MAGAYNDAPSRRLAYDADGTVVVHNQYAGPAAAAIDLTGAQSMALNNETHSEVFPEWGYNRSYRVNFISPELRQIDGVFASRTDYSFNTILAFGSSSDSTNGIDGSWTTEIASPTQHLDTYSLFRDNITSLALVTKSAVRIGYSLGSTNSGSLATVHLYGTISPGETPDRILYLDTEDADAKFSKVLDYGDVPRGQTQTRTIKIKNNSSTKTINTLQLTAEDLYLNAGDWYTFSLDGVSYQATLNTIGNLSPGATKLIYVKQVVPALEALGVQTGRLKTSHASLT